jgi:hypothetical protein
VNDCISAHLPNPDLQLEHGAAKRTCTTSVQGMFDHAVIAKNKVTKAPQHERPQKQGRTSAPETTPDLVPCQPQRHICWRTQRPCGNWQRVRLEQRDRRDDRHRLRCCQARCSVLLTQIGGDDGAQATVDWRACKKATIKWVVFRMTDCYVVVVWAQRQWCDVKQSVNGWLNIRTASSVLVLQSVVYAVFGGAPPPGATAT